MWVIENKTKSRTSFSWFTPRDSLLELIRWLGPKSQKAQSYVVIMHPAQLFPRQYLSLRSSTWKNVKSIFCMITVHLQLFLQWKATILNRYSILWYPKIGSQSKFSSNIHRREHGLGKVKEKAKSSRGKMTNYRIMPYLLQFCLSAAK